MKRNVKEELCWTWLSDIPWFKKLPKYQQARLWDFMFSRLNDLIMIMYHNDGIFPKVREQAYEIIANRNGTTIDLCSPETIGSGLKSKDPRMPFGGCSDVYWAPIILACYDNYHHNFNTNEKEGTLLKWYPEVKQKKLKL